MPPSQLAGRAQGSWLVSRSLLELQPPKNRIEQEASSRAAKKRILKGRFIGLADEEYGSILLKYKGILLAGGHESQVRARAGGRIKAAEVSVHHLRMKLGFFRTAFIVRFFDDNLACTQIAHSLDCR